MRCSTKIESLHRFYLSRHKHNLYSLYNRYAGDCRLRITPYIYKLTVLATVAERHIAVLTFIGRHRRDAAVAQHRETYAQIIVSVALELDVRRLAHAVAAQDICKPEAGAVLLDLGDLRLVVREEQFQCPPSYAAHLRTPPLGAAYAAARRDVILDLAVEIISQHVAYVALAQ